MYSFEKNYVSGIYEWQTGWVIKICLRENDGYAYTLDPLIIFCMVEFTEQVKNLLVNAGWYKGRNINIDLLIRGMEKEKYVITPSVEYFLKEFGELHITFLLQNGKNDGLHFNPIKAIGDINSIWVKEDYSNRLNNRNLCLIGQAYSNHLTLMMDDTGKVYGGYDDNLYFIGESGKEAIQAICLNYKLKEIPL